MFPSDLLAHMFDDEFAFLLWTLLALTGLIFVTASKRRVYRTVGASLLFIGIVGAIPHTERTLRTLKELFTPAPRANPLVLAQDQTIDGIAFHAGSTVSVMPNGVLLSAELKSPHAIDGLAVTGHVEFWHVNEGQNRLTLGTLAVDQEVPNSEGAWCSAGQPIRMDVTTRSLSRCRLAHPLTAYPIAIPAGADIGYRARSLIVDLAEVGAPSSMDGLLIPAGWHVIIQLEPPVAITGPRAPMDPQPPNQLWLEIHGVPLTGSIAFPENGAKVEGELWQDAMVEGKACKKGEQVRFRR